MPVLYTVSENEGMVEVCVTAAESVQLERPISYSIQTIEDSAMGKQTFQYQQANRSAVFLYFNLSLFLN